MPVPDWGVRQEILGGKCLLQISIAQDELAASTAPSPLFLLISRQFYLSSCFSKILKHFENFIVRSDLCALYLSPDASSAVPLHFPVGLLLDLFFPLGHSGPFPFTVRFGNNCANFSYLNQLKASCALRDRTSFPNFHKLPKELIVKLQSVEQPGSSTASHHESEYLEILDKEVYSPSDQPLLKVPFKVYVSSADYATALCRPEATVAEALADVVDHPPSRVIVQGVEIPPETEMLWLSLHAAALDGWLHLVLN
jgi:hypothetical protein